MDKISCTRCLGKGHVDETDIARLGRENEWLPNKCAFCNGSGEISMDFARQHNPDSLEFIVSGLTLPDEKEKDEIPILTSLADLIRDSAWILITLIIASSFACIWSYFLTSDFNVNHNEIFRSIRNGFSFSGVGAILLFIGFTLFSLIANFFPLYLLILFIRVLWFGARKSIKFNLTAYGLFLHILLMVNTSFIFYARWWQNKTFFAVFKTVHDIKSAYLSNILMLDIFSIIWLAVHFLYLRRSNALAPIENSK